MCASLLEGCECRGKRPHDVAPSGHRSACVFAPHQRDAGGMRNDHFVWDFEAAGLRADFDLLGRAQRLHENVVAGEPQIDEGHRGGGLVAPVAHGAAGRKRVARHNVAGVQGLLGLIVQRLADVLDRVDEVQAGGEQLQGSRRAAGVGMVNWARSSSGPVCAGQIGRAGQKRQWAPRSRRAEPVSASAQAAR